MQLKVQKENDSYFLYNNGTNERKLKLVVVFCGFSIEKKEDEKFDCHWK